LPTSSWIGCTLIVLAFGDVDADRKRAQQAVERERVQTSLEYGELNREDFGSFSSSGGFKLPFSLSAPSVGDLGTTALYLGLAAVAIVALLAVGRSVMRRREQFIVVAPNSLRPAGGELMDRSADELFAEADQWAAKGAWDVAVHSLLLAAIRGLSDEFGPPRKSRTSRELIAHFQLDGERRDAFRKLVTVVERAVFGGRFSDEEEYRRCRDFAAAARGVAS
jgi:Domain of unknown function (DUF4129)